MWLPPTGIHRPLDISGICQLSTTRNTSYISNFYIQSSTVGFFFFFKSFFLPWIALIVIFLTKLVYYRQLYSFSQSLWCISHITSFAQQLVQPPQHLVMCAHHSSSLSFLPTNCKCFWTCINCFHTTHCCFIALSFAYVISNCN